MEAVLAQEGHLEAKNNLLRPLYRELKSTFRHMTYTPETKLLLEFKKHKNQIEAAGIQTEKGLELLKQEYSKLYAHL